jgi:hypothetical protein
MHSRTIGQSVAPDVSARTDSVDLDAHDATHSPNVPRTDDDMEVVILRKARY